MISRIDFQNLKSGLQIYPFFYQFSICLKQTSKTKSKSLYSVKSVSITRVEPTSKPRLCQHPRPDKSGIKDVQLFHYPFSFSTFPGMILENHPFHRSEQTPNQNWGVQSNRLWFIIFQNLFFFFRWIARQCCQSAILTVSKLALKWIPSHETDSLRAGDGSRLIPAAAGYGQTGQSGRVRIFFVQLGSKN